MTKGTTLRLLFAIACLNAISLAHAQEQIGLWKQFRVEYTNSSWSGNPFDVDLTASFVHNDSGRTLRQFGFYAGNNVWKIYFMPDRLGAWTFTTSSSDPELNGHSGALEAVPSGLPGRLEVDSIRWRLSDRGPVSPIMLAAGPYIRSTPVEQTESLADWAHDTAGAHVIGTTLLNFAGDSAFTYSQEDRVYEDDAEGSLFYLPAWDRSNDFYDAVRDREMGHYVMLYSDDASTPDLHGLSAGPNDSIGPAELRLFKYVVARFAAYPIVMWDSGIDIGEYRSNAWVTNFVAWFDANDPWQHPVASRSGHASRGVQPQIATYYSDGERTLPGRSALVSTVESRSVATALTDRYREDFVSPFDGGRAKVRRAAWQTLLTYGTAVYFGGNQNAGYLGPDFATDLQAAPDLGHVTRFAENYISDLGNMVPDDAAVITSAGEVMLSRTDTSEYVAYIASGATLAINILDGVYDALWYDPFSGEATQGGSVAVSGLANFTTPGLNSGGTSEWVLKLQISDDGDGIPDPIDNCPYDSNADQRDTDGDQVGDACDNCIETSNPDQCDVDEDGFGNLCDGDLNQDSVSNTLDLGVFRAEYSAPSENSVADLDCDGIVNLGDLAIFRDLFGKPPGPSTVSP